jgi:antitoxin ParD1/3/4
VYLHIIPIYNIISLLQLSEVDMQKNTSVTLGAHFEKFLASQINEGRFSSASEAVREGLRLLEERETKLQTLRNALIDGEKSGVSDYNYKNIISELDKS